MAWNGNFTVYDLPAGMEVESRGMAVERHPLGESAASGKGGGSQAVQEKKRRLTPEQIEFLENSFQEEAKLEPERKLMLARQLSLQPRQVAVWFQNRRARWKNKQLEHLYASLKHDFDAVSMEKQKLQDEVMKLKAELQERAMPRGSAGEKEDETLESMVMVRCTSSNCTSRPQGSSHHQVSDCNYLLNVDDCLHWGVFPGYM